MFVGRDEELIQLRQTFGESGSATLIYGKRRVGKTTLIKQAIEGQKKCVVYYECIKGTIKENVEAFTQVLQNMHLLTFAAEFNSFQDVFAFLNTLSRDFIIVIDEYPYLKTMSPGASVDSAFQYIIDNNLANIDIVLSGSQIGIMKEMLEEGNALYGRFDRVIRLRELSYREAAAFYPSQTPYDRIAMFSVFGGSPFVLEQIRKVDTLKQSIIRTILDETNPVHLYASNLLLSDYSNSMNAERIFAALGNGRKKYSELENSLNANRTGNLAKQLKYLTSMEIVRRTTPINRPNDTKKSGYEINDNLMRFYYTFVYRNRSALQMLGPDAFYEQYVAPTLTEFISHRFEELCRDYFSFEAKNGRLKGVRNIGSYYYDDPVNRKNGEFDVALEFEDGFTLIEVKYYAKPMTLDEIHREVGQIHEITELSVAGVGFVAASGFSEREAGYLYYTAEDLYK